MARRICSTIPSVALSSGRRVLLSWMGCWLSLAFALERRSSSIPRESVRPGHYQIMRRRARSRRVRPWVRGEMPSVAIGAPVGTQAPAAMLLAGSYGVESIIAGGVSPLRGAGFFSARPLSLDVKRAGSLGFALERVVRARKLRTKRSDALRPRRRLPTRHNAPPLQLF